MDLLLKKLLKIHNLFDLQTQSTIENLYLKRNIKQNLGKYYKT